MESISGESSNPSPYRVPPVAQKGFDVIALIPFLPAVLTFLFGILAVVIASPISTVLGVVFVLAALLMLVTLHKKFHKVL